MPDTTALGERIAAIEAQIADIAAREDKAADDRKAKWDVLNAVRDQVKDVSSQQALIIDRLNAMGQMAQVARDFVAAARDIPTRADFEALRSAMHTSDLRMQALTTEFNLVKSARDQSAQRMWVVISGALVAGVGSAFGWIVTWLSKH